MFGSTTGGFGGFGAAKPATSGFGTAQPASGFGSTQLAQIPAFGAAPASAPSFGSTSAAPSFGTTAPSTLGFGTTTPATSGFGTTAPATSGFGTTAPTTSGFGTTAPATSGFGTTAPTTSGFGAAPSTSGFGATQPAFGSSAPQTSSFGGFGTTSAQANQPSTFSGFGQTSSTFGAPAMGNASMNSFGQQQQMQQAPSTTGKIARSIEKLQQAYAPYQDVAGKSSVSAAAGRYNDECMFKTYMYDRRSGSAQGADPSLTGTLLEQAELNNPDPSRYYPVRIMGIDALKARFDQQHAESLKLKEHTQNLAEVIESVSQSNTQLETHFASLRMRQTHLYQRLLSLLRKVEVLRCRGVPVEDAEIRYRAVLHQIAAAMKNPYLQIQELANNVAQQEFPQDVYADAPSDSADLEALYDALRRQREGLEYVTEILEKDVRDMKIVKTAMQDGGSGGLMT